MRAAPVVVLTFRVFPALGVKHGAQGFPVGIAGAWTQTQVCSFLLTNAG